MNANPSTIEAFVYSITWAGTDMLCYELRTADSHAGDCAGQLATFAAGAHIDVHIAPGLIRQYSLCNNPAERYRYVVCVHRDEQGRGGSRTLHDTIRIGQTVRISLPRNNFPLDPAERYVLIAGGIGITPLLAMAEHLQAIGASFELHVYARTADRIPLADCLTRGPLAAHTQVHLSSSGDSLRENPPTYLTAPTASTLVYTCGPEGFMQAVAEYAHAAGFSPDQIRQERFQSAVATPVSDPTANGSFDVVVASTNQRVTVSPDQTIAEALSGIGVDVELSCEQGMCGACLTPVLSGIPDHRDDIQTAVEHEANTQITVCCSRAKSEELVLDL